ncbi:MAG TPA: DegQ family serine endoprotease [Fibrobacteria bacterium]|nr:DegQ family serine endoprotease [Fibrobacteria bacterium]
MTQTHSEPGGRKSPCAPRRARWVLPGLCLGLVAGLAGCKSELKAETPSRQAEAAQSQPVQSTGSQARYGAFQTVFTEVAKKTVPSVVSVAMERTVTAPQNPFEFFFDQNPFFDGGDGMGPPDRGPRKRKESGLGSGFITDAQGYILTNNHVVEGAQKLTVQLSDEREFEAEVVGTDKPSDLAVIKIKGKVPADLVPLKFGDSDKLEIGEWVVAVGAPFGLYETVTTGIISAKGRQNTGISTYGNFLQTDAAINPGNSGGPLVNLDGRAVGINTAIYSQSGGYQGIGFAIPVNLAKNIMESLIKNGKVTRGWLGVSIQPVSQDMAEALGLKQRRGALVGDVVPGGPAEKAGLKRGDVILKLQGQDVRDANDLMNRIALIPPGSAIDLNVFRDGKERTLKAKAAKRDEEKLARESGAGGLEEGTEGGDISGLGLEAADLTDEARRQYQIGKNPKAGALVTRVDPEGSAAEAGIQEGDVIVEANRKQVESAQDLQGIVSKEGKGRKILFLVNRKGSTFFSMAKAK